MLLVYGFIEEPRLLLHGAGGGQHAHICATALTQQLAKSQPGLLVASMVALHENSKVQLEQADHIFQVCTSLVKSRQWIVASVWQCLCAQEVGCENCLQVDFWEAMLMASSQEAIIQELLFRVASVYIDRLTNANTGEASKRRSLKSAEDLVLELITTYLCFLYCPPHLFPQIIDKHFLLSSSSQFLSTVIKTAYHCY